VPGDAQAADGPRTALEHALAVGRALLGVPILRLAWLPAPDAQGDVTPTGDAPVGDLPVSNARRDRGTPAGHFAATDPVALALATEVQRRGGPLMVEDTRAAAPLHGVALVDGLRIMACLAAPLPLEQPGPFAVLCALDSVPRWWSERQDAQLRALAHVIAALLAPRAPAIAAAAAPDSASPPVVEAIGELAGGVAHDFNNLLTVIAANAELLRQHPPEAGVPTVELDAIERAAGEAAELTRQLLAFGRQLPQAPSPLSVHRWLAEEEGALREVVPAGVQLEFTLRADAPHVHVDPSLLRDALIALVRHASDATPDGGLVRIESARLRLDAPCPAQPAPVPPGDWIRLSVIDNGAGLSASAQRRFFEPFFTTRDVRRGRWLGLSAVYGTVAQSGGCATVESAPAAGTRVHLWLPSLPRP
jgi:signal transduction histidine kinase